MTQAANKDKPAIMVLGAGRGQVGLIRAAKRIGLHTIVASLPSETAPGIPLADEMVWADIADPDAIEAAAREQGIRAIATSCADTGLPALGRVVDTLGLPGLGQQAALICADKKLMKTAFSEGGVRSAQHRMVSDLDQLRAATAEIGLPVIIKATDLQGSKGIVIVRDEASLEAGFAEVQAATSRDEIIVEEFIEGTEFGAQALVHEGEVQFVLLHSDGVHMAQTAVPVLHAVPLEADEAFQQRAVDETRKAIAAVGLDNCAVNVDLIARGDEVFVIELTGRVGANGLGEMVSRYFGLDYFETVARLALGQHPTGPWREADTSRPAVVVKMIIAPLLHGILSKVEVDQYSAPEAEFMFFRQPGDEVDGFAHSGDCIGQITVSADTLADAYRLLETAEAAVTLEVE